VKTLALARDLFRPVAGNHTIARAMSKALVFMLLSTLFTPAWQPAHAAGASFYASPSGGSYTVGQVVRVSVLLNTGGQGINAVSGTVTWSGPLQYSFVSTSGTIITNWTSGGGSGPVGSAGSVFFEGGLPGSGYNGTGGRILTVVFNAVGVGQATVNINGTQALVGDGTGSNAYCCSSGASFSISKPKPPTPLLTVQSSSHPDQSRWYNNRSVKVNWYATTAVGNYRYAFDRNARTEPGGPNNGATSASYDANADGTWFFHLSASNETGGSTVHYQINIDTQPPNEFSIKVDNEGSASNPTPKAVFEAADTASGIERYDAIIDGGEPFAIASGGKLPRVRPGEHTLIVRAYDRAGNVRESKTTYKIDGIAPPKILQWTKLSEILQPLNFIGRSDPDDTIIVYLGDKEVDKFIAKDKQVAKDRADLAAVNDDGGFAQGVTWEYQYKQDLFPGKYEFRFARTNTAGAESSLSPKHGTEIKAVFYHFRDWTFEPHVLIKVLIAIIIFLLLVIAYLLGKVHRHWVLRILRRPAPMDSSEKSRSQHARRMWNVLLRRKNQGEGHDITAEAKTVIHKTKPKANTVKLKVEPNPDAPIED
jgi:hypothetical protein